MTIALPPLETQHEVNLARWAELLADPDLPRLPGRPETDRHGHLTMSPPAHPQHGRKQTKIASLLETLSPSGVTITECPVSTSDGVKAVDVAWCTADLWEQVGEQVCLTVAPQICVEVVSPSNSKRELAEKRALYFEAGAEEVWFCQPEGSMQFMNPEGSIERSIRCPDFPLKLVL